MLDLPWSASDTFSCTRPDIFHRTPTLEALATHGIPEQIFTDNGKVFTGKLGKRPANVLFDRICLNNGIRHILTAPYSPTTTGKIERLHKTMRKEFFSGKSFDSSDDIQVALDAWVADYNNHERELQALGDVPPIRRFELARPASLEVIDCEVATEEEPQPVKKVIGRRVDRTGRISILKHRYHVGRHLTGEAVTVESANGLLHISHNGVVVATHARRHLIDDDDKMDRRPSTRADRGNPPREQRFCGSSITTARSASRGRATASATLTAARPSASAWLVTPSRSPLTEPCCALIVLVTTAPRSSEPWLSPEASLERPALVGHSYRSRSGTRVLRLHKPPAFKPGFRC